MLASASADTTVKLWDLSRAACLRSFAHHADKVQSAVWNPAESTVLLTGAFDKTAKVPQP
jgi:periodic tryptophan protein 1